MDYLVETKVSPKTAAKLIMSNEADLACNWSTKQASAIVQALLDFDLNELLLYLDSIDQEAIIGAENIPQFQNIDYVISIPGIVVESSNPALNYATMGLLLKQDPNASVIANVKYGENYGKGAALIGIVNCENSKFVKSALSNYFKTLACSEQKYLATVLCMRIPYIQTLLKAARDGRVNGYKYLSFLKRSTQERRAFSLRNILENLRSLNNDNITFRVNNVFWE